MTPELYQHHGQDCFISGDPTWGQSVKCFTGAESDTVAGSVLRDCSTFTATRSVLSIDADHSEELLITVEFTTTTLFFTRKHWHVELPENPSSYT